jgi:hypothetical protein
VKEEAKQRRHKKKRTCGRLKDEVDTGAGVDAVGSEIISEFPVTNIYESYETELTATVPGLAAEGRHFAVRVSDESDEDFESGQIRVDLKELRPRLRGSKDGKAIVRRSGIST